LEGKSSEEKIKILNKIKLLKIDQIFKDTNIENGYLRLVKDIFFQKLLINNKNYQKVGIVAKSSNSSKNLDNIKIEGSIFFFDKE
jgi:hypothetical protein